MLDFYKGKRVLVTGHTGFKGSWLCKILIQAGAVVCGYALEMPVKPNLFELTGNEKQMISVTGDIRDRAHLLQVFRDFQPEIVIHMAAQPIVRESYANPVDTYEINVMGTVNICEAVRLNPCVKSFLNVTTDKVYKNEEREMGYSESDPLDGFDPYSNSKSCSELITHSYNNSFLSNLGIAVSTARAGNVIGGGDFAKDRIIPDCVRAVLNKQPIVVRNQYSVRPYQHVLEPLGIYLLIAQKQYEDKTLAGYYNVGPDDEDCVTTGQLVTMFCNNWNQTEPFPTAGWEAISENNAPHEANYLRLNCNKIKETFGWKPTWGIEKAIEKTVEWTRAYRDNQSISECMEMQISEFFRK